MPEEEPRKAPAIGDIHLLIDDPARRRQVQALLAPPRNRPSRPPVTVPTVADLHVLVEDPARRRHARAVPFCRTRLMRRAPSRVRMRPRWPNCHVLRLAVASWSLIPPTRWICPKSKTNCASLERRLNLSEALFTVRKSL